MDEGLVLVHVEHQVDDLYWVVIGTCDDSTQWDLIVNVAMFHGLLEWSIVLATERPAPSVRLDLGWLREALTPMLSRALAKLEVERLEADCG